MSNLLCDEKCHGSYIIADNGKSGDEFRVWWECEECKKKSKEYKSDEEAFEDIQNWE